MYYKCYTSHGHSLTYFIMTAIVVTLRQRVNVHENCFGMELT